MINYCKSLRDVTTYQQSQTIWPADSFGGFSFFHASSTTFQPIASASEYTGRLMSP
jgi:hypothetical protein